MEKNVLAPNSWALYIWQSFAGGFVTEGERSPSFPSPYFTTQLYKSEHACSGRRQATEKWITFKREDLTWKLDNNSIESRSTSGRSRLIDLLNSEKNRTKLFKNNYIHTKLQTAEMFLKDTKSCFCTGVRFAGYGRSREKREKQSS